MLNLKVYNKTNTYLTRTIFHTELLNMFPSYLHTKRDTSSYNFTIVSNIIQKRQYIFALQQSCYIFAEKNCLTTYWNLSKLFKLTSFCLFLFLLSHFYFLTLLSPPPSTPALMAIYLILSKVMIPVSNLAHSW
jgi:hypothetical protein